MVLDFRLIEAWQIIRLKLFLTKFDLASSSSEVDSVIVVVRLMAVRTSRREEIIVLWPSMTQRRS